MTFTKFRAFCLASAAAMAFSATAQAQLAFTTPNIDTTAGATSVTLNGATFTNSGLVGMGRIAAGTKDFLGDTFGAFSGMDLNLAAWRRNADGSYSGALFALPDRGPNGIGAVSFSDYAGRISAFNIGFTPYTGTANLPAAVTSQNQLTFTANGGITLRDFNGNVTTGFDPGTGSASVITQNGIQLPGQTSGTAAGKISLDAEGVRFLRDRSFYVSDEYGANVYYFNAAGQLQGVIRPPNALLPRDAAGNLSYSSLVDPVTGRRPNQGLEGVAVTPDGKKLVTLLQSAAMQDSNSNQQTRTNTRLMIYDISASKTPTNPTAEYVMQLPTYTLAGNGAAANRTAAQSEILALNDTQFLVLSRDGLGLGTGTGNPVFKSIMLIDTASATNIAGTTFETAANGAVSPAGGALTSSIRPVSQVQLVNMLNSTQLAKFGGNLNNVTPNRLTIAEKWEGMALAPVLDQASPQDFFLFVGNDNDFLATNCLVGGQNCSQTVDSDANVMIYRLTLPTYVDPEYLASM
ncbi:MAG: esterase-like activity of phytase family protein, partial [Rhodospirillaceae bacterium]|nr:esterase-like activity of phytase family protein [Rhodospirillaceae bacterium]